MSVRADTELADNVVMSRKLGTDDRIIVLCCCLNGGPSQHRNKGCCFLVEACSLKHPSIRMCMAGTTVAFIREHNRELRCRSIRKSRHDLDAFCYILFS